MRRSRRIAVVLIGFVGATLTVGQGNSGKTPAYDVKSEVVVRGKVTSVAMIPDWMGTSGVNVTLQSSDAFPVHVDTAPAEFLKMLDFTLAAGDDLEVVGVWTKWDGQRVFLARTMTRQKVAVSVRDPEGTPVW